jgi:hypothetical protein
LGFVENGFFKISAPERALIEDGVGEISEGDHTIIKIEIRKDVTHLTQQSQGIRAGFTDSLKLFGT